MNDVSVYLGRQREEGSLIERMHFVDSFFVFNQERHAFRFANVRNSSAWAGNYKLRPLARSFDGPLSPSVYLVVHVLHTASDQKLDSGKAWERGYPKAALISRESENEASACIVISM